MSSNLVNALYAALLRFRSDEVFKDIAELSQWIRARLVELGFEVVAPYPHASPAAITIALPQEIDSNSVGSELRERGYLLSYQSEYLLKRNWIQICLMGECSQEKISPLLDLLKELRGAPAPAGA